MIKFMSIDPSLRNTGIVVGTIDSNDIVTIEHIELIETTKSKNKKIRISSDTVARFRKTRKIVNKLIKEYNPAIIFAETPSGSQNAKAMMSYGISCALIGSIDPSPIQVTPLEVKKAVYGKATTSKQVIIDWAVEKHPEANFLKRGDKILKKNEHIADAIAATYAGLKTDDYSRLKAMMKPNF